MTIKAKVIEDSISKEGIRLTTFELYYPWMVHWDFMTHRKLSRSAASNRAIPVKTMLRNTVRDMAEPVEWGQNQPGMQAKKELTGFRRWLARRLWRTTGYTVCAAVWLADKIGLHKQVANRMLTPWGHARVIVTATDWENFFALRAHEDADPTIRLLAEKMQEARKDSKPKLLKPGEWHMPYVSLLERRELNIKDQLRVSSARCARVSHRLHDGKPTTLDKDRQLFTQLVESKPVHASPTEHQATPDKKWSRDRWSKPREHGNLYGWRQHRKMIPGEAVEERT